jgi:drug/metabolite transporter (DMT)-like permease
MSLGIYIGVFFASIFGAWLNVLVRKGHFFYLSYLATFLTASLWLFIVKFTTNKLSTASLIFDVILSAGYLAGFLILGKERLSPAQILGAILAIAGIILLNWGKK